MRSSPRCSVSVMTSSGDFMRRPLAAAPERQLHVGGVRSVLAGTAAHGIAAQRRLISSSSDGAGVGDAGCRRRVGLDAAGAAARSRRDARGVALVGDRRRRSSAHRLRIASTDPARRRRVGVGRRLVDGGSASAGVAVARRSWPIVVGEVDGLAQQVGGVAHLPHRLVEDAAASRSGSRCPSSSARRTSCRHWRIASGSFSGPEHDERQQQDDDDLAALTG